MTFLKKASTTEEDVVLYRFMIIVIAYG